MAYWGYKTPANFAVWLITAVLLVTGAVWLIIGGVDAAGCRFCYNQLGSALRTNADPKIDKGCIVAAFAFELYEPKLASEADARVNFYDWCLGTTGPLVEMIAGAAIFAAGLLLLSYFCCCGVRPSSVAPKV